jgi:arylsulfatase
MADDMGYSDVGSFGGEIRTPHLDRLADQGLRFTHFYNSARCAPTRASLLTGLYPHQVGMGGVITDYGLEPYRGDVMEGSVTIPEVLRGAGYSTYVTGKWHVTRFLKDDGPKHNWPRQRGVDRFFGTITGAGSYFEPMTLTSGDEWIEVPSNDFYYTDAISDHTVQYLREHDEERSRDPFFLYVAYTAPHWPLHALEEDMARYEGTYDVGWDVIREQRHRRMTSMGIVDPDWTLTERDQQVPAWDDVEHKEWQSRRMEVYAAQVDRMDQGIGRIVSELERTGAVDDTLILFLSDNGGCREEINDSWLNFILRGGKFVSRDKTLDGKPIRIGNDPSVLPGPYDTYQSYGRPWANVSNTPFRLYKSRVHEGGVATPLIVSWPSRIHARGEFRRQTGHIIDIMATLVDVTGASYPTERKGHPVLPMEGRSLVPAFDDRSLEREAIYFEHEGSRAVIAGKWKLVADGKDGSWELYDLERDRTETHNLAEQDPERVEELASSWHSWAERAGVLPWPWENH